MVRSLPYEQEMRKIVAYLYWINEGAVRINEKGFVLKSGKRSPIYLDGRALMSYPLAISLMTEFAREIVDGLPVDVICGGESAGIPYGQALAQRMGLPFVYARKKLKDYGTGSRIEGVLKPEQRVILVEDLITDGGSKENFIQGLRSSGGIVEHCLVMFDRLQGGIHKLRDMGVDLLSLTDMDALLEVGLEGGYMTEEVHDSIESYCLHPNQWKPAKLFVHDEEVKV